MQHESDNFDQLRRLMALKRHEQPPPGYFHRFPGEVISRIRAGEHDQASSVFGWLGSFLGQFRSQPVLAAAVGAASCALLLLGVVLSNENVETGASPLPAQATVEAGMNLASRSSRNDELQPGMLAAFETTNSFGGVSALSSLFPAQPVSFITSFGH